MRSSDDVTMEVERLSTLLNLQPHPEGGYYRETYRHQPEDGERGACTAIYYVLKGGAYSAWHRVLDAEEVWCFHQGASLELEMRSPDGDHESVRLGHDLVSGETPQAVVPQGYWQRARSLGGWSLTSCIVAPAFEFSAFEMKAPGEDL